MEQYYYTDGKERYGPFTIEQLRGRNITPETLTWKEGMPDWLAAKNLSDLQTLFMTSESIGSTPPVIMTPPFREMPPKNWLVESILVTICCCLPFGIVGIVNATKVEALWNTGQKEAALKASQEAGKWVKIGFFTGIIVIALYIILVFFGILAGIGAGLSH
ncbi:MAG: CD225/dispanin family protein [Saprospiraceae bacterium]